jgi:hypothetical protein
MHIINDLNRMREINRDTTWVSSSAHALLSSLELYVCLLQLVNLTNLALADTGTKKQGHPPPDHLVDSATCSLENPS